MFSLPKMSTISASVSRAFSSSPAQQPLVDRAGNAAGEADDALGKLAQRVAVHARLAVVEAFEIALGDEFAEIVPALVVFGEQRHVGGALAAGELLLVLHFPRGEVDLAAEDRLHPGLVALLVELDRAVEVAVVGHRHRGHARVPSARLARSLMRIMPSSRENSVCRWRWTKESDIGRGNCGCPGGRGQGVVPESLARRRIFC